MPFFKSALNRNFRDTLLDDKHAAPVWLKVIGGIGLLRLLVAFALSLWVFVAGSERYQERPVSYHTLLGIMSVLHLSCVAYGALIGDRSKMN